MNSRAIPPVNREQHHFSMRVTMSRMAVLSLAVAFEDFAATVGLHLRVALVAAYGPEIGLDAAAEAIAYGWQHWDRVGAMSNPAGYLYRVGQSAARREFRRREVHLPSQQDPVLPDFDPGLVPALRSLTEHQRVAVVMVHGFGWSQMEVAEVLSVSPSTVRTHIARALAHMKEALEVTENAD
jgi:RNA polymerase sigma factor (sigma-70 family)